jgi:hypothetical protein
VADEANPATSASHDFLIAQKLARILTGGALRRVSGS